LNELCVVFDGVECLGHSSDVEPAYWWVDVGQWRYLCMSDEHMCVKTLITSFESQGN